MRESYAVEAVETVVVDIDRPLPQMAVCQSVGRLCGKGGRGRAANAVAENERPP